MSRINQVTVHVRRAGSSTSRPHSRKVVYLHEQVIEEPVAVTRSTDVRATVVSRAMHHARSRSSKR